MSVLTKTPDQPILSQLFGKLEDWSLFERLWISIFTIINISLFFTLDDTILGLISSLSGMLCVVLVAKGKISNYLFGLIQVATYGYIAYSYGLFGETILNWGFYVPIQFIGFYLWYKNSSNNTTSDVKARTLSFNQAILIIITTIVSIVLFSLGLKYIGGVQVGLDSATTILSIVAQILMILRYAEQWLVWIIINVLSIIMWVITLDSSGGNDWSIVIMWTAFLVNSVYGYVNWKKIVKDQEV